MHPFSLPKIYPITDRLISGLSHAAQIRQLAAAGAGLIQLRDKDASGADLYADAVAARALMPHGSRLLINDRVDVALAANADGVHLGQDDLPPEEARRILGAGRVIGFSTHSVRQAIDAIGRPVDYIAAGPVFSTSSKKDPEATIGLEGLAEIRAAIGDFPLVAIGGINSDNICSVLAAGADCAAVISAVLSPSQQIADNYSLLAETANKKCKQS